MIKESSYELEEINSQEIGIVRPAGLDFYEGVLYVCDSEAGTIVMLDEELNPLGTIGTIGMGEGEFQKPMAIEVTETHIYVLDTGNRRIQVLDREGVYEREIELPELITEPGLFGYNSIAVNSEEMICVGTDAVHTQDNKIRMIIGDELLVTEESVLGCVFLYEDEFYAVNTLEDSSTSGQYRASSGRNVIYKIEKSGLTELAELPNKFAPVSPIEVDGELYMISSSFGQLGHVSLEGEIIEGLVNLPVQSRSLCMASEDPSCFFVTDREAGKLYCLYQMGDNSRLYRQ